MRVKRKKKSAKNEPHKNEKVMPTNTSTSLTNKYDEERYHTPGKEMLTETSPLVADKLSVESREETVAKSSFEVLPEEGVEANCGNPTSPHDEVEVPTHFCMCGAESLRENVSDTIRSLRDMFTPIEKVEKYKQQDDATEELKELSSTRSIKTDTTIAASSSHDTSISSSLEKKATYQPSLYMRATDLVPYFDDSCEELQQFDQGCNEDSGAHIDRPAPNGNLDPLVSTELFIALDSSPEMPSPALHHAKVAFQTESKKFIADTNWTPQWRKNTQLECDLDRILKKVISSTDTEPVSLSPKDSKILSKEILLWTMSTPQRPIAIRSCACIDMSPSDLFELIWNSSKTKEYNPFSCGRKDLWIIQDDDNIHMKVARGETAVLRKTLPFITFFHGDTGKNSGGHRYMITTRTAKLVGDDGKVIDAKSFIGEIKMGTNLILGIKGQPDKCLFMSAMEAGKSPLPLMISKRIGLASSVNFINGLHQAAKRAKSIDRQNNMNESDECAL